VGSCEVGRSVGLGDGSSEGIGLGAGLGITEGKGLGAGVGFTDGFVVGTFVGPPVGYSVGVTVSNNWHVSVDRDISTCNKKLSTNVSIDHNSHS